MVSPRTFGKSSATAVLLLLLLLGAVLSNVGHAQECSGNFTTGGDKPAIFDCPRGSECTMTGDYFTSGYGGSVEPKGETVVVRGTAEFECLGNTTCSFDCCSTRCTYNGTIPSGATTLFAGGAVAVVSIVATMLMM